MLLLRGIGDTPSLILPPKGGLELAREGTVGRLAGRKIGLAPFSYGCGMKEESCVPGRVTISLSGLGRLSTLFGLAGKVLSLGLIKPFERLSVLVKVSLADL